MSQQPNQRFKDKVAVVTGGNSGIGLATARAFAREGARVAITGRSEATLKAAEKEIGPGTLALRTDMAKVEEIVTAMDRIRGVFGRIDALFVNHGVAHPATFESVTEERFDETVDTNVKGAFFTIQKALPLLTRESAVILNASNSYSEHTGRSVVIRFVETCPIRHFIVSKPFPYSPTARSSGIRVAEGRWI